jgi:hypothetical protein
VAHPAAARFLLQLCGTLRSFEARERRTERARHRIARDEARELRRGHPDQRDVERRRPLGERDPAPADQRTGPEHDTRVNRDDPSVAGQRHIGVAAVRLRFVFGGGA